MTVMTLIKEFSEVRIEDKQTGRTFPIIWVREVFKDGKTCFYISFDSESVG